MRNIVRIWALLLGASGLSVPVSLVYDSKGWWGSIPGDLTPTWVKPAQGAQPTQFWRLSAPLTVRAGISFKVSGKCGVNNSQSYLPYTYTEDNGTLHTFPPVKCGNVTGNTIYAIDGSGYSFRLDTAKVINKAGVSNYYYQDPQNQQLNLDVLEDTNGNRITRSDGSLGLASTITDTLGRAVNITFVLNSSTGKYELAYYDSNGNQQKIIMTKSPVAIHTNLCGDWNCGDGCNEYNGTWQMPTEIDLPNGMKYLIAYSNNAYGMPSSIQLPTGATISYTYGGTSGYNNACRTAGSAFDYDDSGPRVTSRTITNGSQVATWSYNYLCATQGGYSDQTVVTSPPTAISPNRRRHRSFVHTLH
jgi:hypothetical protein